MGRDLAGVADLDVERGRLAHLDFGGATFWMVTWGTCGPSRRRSPGFPEPSAPRGASAAGACAWHRAGRNPADRFGWDGVGPAGVETVHRGARRIRTCRIGCKGIRLGCVGTGCVGTDRRLRARFAGQPRPSQLRAAQRPAAVAPPGDGVCLNKAGSVVVRCPTISRGTAPAAGVRGLASASTLTCSGRVADAGGSRRQRRRRANPSRQCPSDWDH